MRKLADNQISYLAVQAAKRIYFSYRAEGTKFYDEDAGHLSDQDLERIYNLKANIYREHLEKIILTDLRSYHADKVQIMIDRMLTLAEFIAKLENNIEERGIDYGPFHMNEAEEKEAIEDFSKFDEDYAHGKKYYVITKGICGDISGCFIDDAEEIQNETCEIVKLLEAK